jgi:sulfonate transport system substrate-binding protein
MFAMGRKKIWVTLLLLTMSGLLVSWASAAPKLDELNVSYSPMPLNAPTIVAKQTDLLVKSFESEGIDVHYVSFMAGPQMTEAMAAKALDIASVMGATSAIVARTAGVDLKVIGAYSMAPQGFAVAVRNDSSIDSIKDLKGKKVGGPQGTAADQLLAALLGKENLQVKDVQFLNMQVPDAATALVAKQLDAAILVEPVLTKLVDAKKVKVLKDGTGVIGGLTVITARGDLVKKNPAVLKRFLKVHRQSVDYVKTHSAQALDLISTETQLTKDQVRKLLPKYDFDPDLRPEVLTELKDCIDFLYEIGLTKKRIELSDLVAEGF